MSAQTWDPTSYRRHASFVPALGAPVLALLAPAMGERILDLGCGDGQLTRRIAETGAEVVAVDSSAAMVAAAREMGLDARVVSGEALTFDGEFDAVFSNAALHWMKDHERVVAGVRRALKPAGRFVGEFGGFGNVAAVVTALHAALLRRDVDFGRIQPWNYPTAEGFRALLMRHDFEVASCELIPRPTALPSGMETWLQTFANPFLSAVPSADQAELRSEVVRLLEPALRTNTGAWFADYVRLRFVAVLAD